MRISARLANITDEGSDGWDIFYRARRMAMVGESVIELTIGEHDIRTDRSILNAMHRAATAGHTGYALVPGTDSLRDAVAARVRQRTGISTTSDNVLITPGGQAALFAAHMAVCDMGDTALFCDPYYATYPGTIRGVGAVAQAVPTRSSDAFRPRPEILDVMAPNARSLLINSPNNPTGMVYDRATMEGIAQVCRDHDLWLISDEVYDTQVWDGEHISPRTLPAMAERTLVVGSMSKSHAMTGSRLGWIVAPAEMIAHLINLATHTTYGVPGYIQDAALFALEQGRPLEEKIAAPFRRRRRLAHGILEGQNTVRPIPSMGAMYLMLDIRSTGMDGKAFASALLETHKIAVMPGESFGKAAAGHVRVAMTVEDETFTSALKRLISFAYEVQK